jgi:xylulose-5-phosphate/fructose-6-phosphate phosphoketolase
VEGSFRSHTIPLPNAKHDKEELKMLQNWLQSYGPNEFFSESGDVTSIVKSIIPLDKKKLGQRVETYSSYQAPDLPNWRNFSAEKWSLSSPMKAVGYYMDAVFSRNPRTVRLFSPDELESNKLGQALTHTGRNFQWDQFSMAKGGRIVEVLSEHLCQGFMQGYVGTGRVAIFPSYESFLGIVHTMMVQYSKFRKMVDSPLLTPLYFLRLSRG